MNYTVSELEFARPKEGFVIDVNSLYAAFETLSDQRKRGGIRYKLALILVLIVLAKLSGEDHPYGIAQWGQERKEYLMTALQGHYAGLPSHNTYRRALGNNVQVAQQQAVTTDMLTRSEKDGRSI